MNSCTPKHLCSVKYRDFYHAIQTSINLLKEFRFGSYLFYGKADLVSTFRILPIKPELRKFLLMKVKHPVSQIWYYFIDKCLPFGSSISCAHFQLFSDALAFIMEKRLNMRVTNYLNDFLFIAIERNHCNFMLDKFLEMCNETGCPVSEEKTFRAAEVMTFLGILLDGKNHILAIPQDKCVKALTAIDFIINNKKTTIKNIQKFTWLLIFLQRAIVPGWPFTRRLYDRLKFTDNKGNLLKHYHHVKIDQDIKDDYRVWKSF